MAGPPSRPTESTAKPRCCGSTCGPPADLQRSTGEELWRSAHASPRPSTVTCIDGKGRRSSSCPPMVATGSTISTTLLAGIADAAGASCAQAPRLREARMPMRPYAHSRALSLARPSPCSGCTRQGRSNETLVSVLSGGCKPASHRDNAVVGHPIWTGSCGHPTSTAER